MAAFWGRVGGEARWRSDIRSSSSAAGRSGSALRSISDCAAFRARWSSGASICRISPRARISRRARSSISIAGASPTRCAPSASCRRAYPISGITAYGNLMSEYWFAPPQREIVRPYYFQDVERLPQYLTEKVLRAKMATLPSVEARFGWTAESVDAGRQGRARHHRRSTAASARTLEADYVVGCDGARSIVREQIGIARGGADFDQLMVLAVFRSRELHEGLKRFPDRSTYLVLQPGIERLLAILRPHRCRRGLVLPRAGAGRHDARQLRFPRPASAASPAFHSRANSTMSASGICASPSPSSIRSAACSSPAMPRTAIRPMAASASTTGSRMSAISAGSSRRSFEGWGGDALLDSYGEERRPIFKETGRGFHRRPHRMRIANSSTATIPSATAPNSSAPGGSAPPASATVLHEL